MSDIHSIGPEAFLVCDKSLNRIDSPFLSWLQSEGFKYGGYKGCYDNVCWIHINITNKTYAYGMPGQAIIKATGNHAITIDEFKTIYAIYQKYEGKDLFVFKNIRFDCNSDK